MAAPHPYRSGASSSTATPTKNPHTTQQARFETHPLPFRTSQHYSPKLFSQRSRGHRPKSLDIASAHRFRQLMRLPRIPAESTKAATAKLDKGKGRADSIPSFSRVTKVEKAKEQVAPIIVVADMKPIRPIPVVAKSTSIEKPTKKPAPIVPVVKKNQDTLKPVPVIAAVEKKDKRKPAPVKQLPAPCNSHIQFILSPRSPRPPAPVQRPQLKPRNHRNRHDPADMPLGDLLLLLIEVLARLLLIVLSVFVFSLVLYWAWMGAGMLLHYLVSMLPGSDEFWEEIAKIKAERLCRC